MCVRYRFARYTRQRREQFGARFLRGFLVAADRQSDRHIDKFAIS